jgi:hypothetical protein
MNTARHNDDDKDSKAYRLSFFQSNKTRFMHGVSRSSTLFEQDPAAAAVTCNCYYTDKTFNTLLLLSGRPFQMHPFLIAARVGPGLPPSDAVPEFRRVLQFACSTVPQ